MYCMCSTVSDLHCQVQCGLSSDKLGSLNDPSFTASLQSGVPRTGPTY